MPPFPPGEARRLSRRRAVSVALVATLAACAARDLHERATRTDATYGTSVFSWAYDHDPARLDVWNLSAAAVSTYLRSGRARAVTGSVADACRSAARDRALLLVVAPDGSAARERALDCGFAVERDRFALVVAPR